MEFMQSPQDIAEAIQDELGAVSMYARMASEAGDPVLRAILLNIAGDEYGHARVFMTMQEMMRTMGAPGGAPAADQGTPAEWAAGR
ncbi:ferritin-like domain-containing protein [Limnochorda pilosa]|uniref:Rubrerythrin n=1 Tax=Limnochorda pilosa TaxID=1555112 RepID=A0A0K2SMB3_LIMPI|nr:ferritin-like domain-containing protein [Limnochorda pilosa]BAS28256.1 hypothetical protein LIP_2415 [Limnochorda pilosa]